MNKTVRYNQRYPFIYFRSDTGFFIFQVGSDTFDFLEYKTKNYYRDLCGSGWRYNVNYISTFDAKQFKTREDLEQSLFIECL